MTTREENKQKLIQKVISRESLCRVLRTINWFGAATESQIAKYQGLSRRRINVILRELYKNNMVRYKEITRFPPLRYWYLVSKGLETLWREIESKLVQKIITQEEYNFLKPASLVRKKRVPNKVDSHSHYIRETIVTLKEKEFVSLSPRVSLWPKKFKEYEQQYKTHADTYCSERIDEWVRPVAVEMENSLKGNFPRKLAKQQKMFSEILIPFLYRPTNREVEVFFANVRSRLENDGEYAVKVRGPFQKYGEYDHKIGIRNALGFLFSNVEMTMFYAISTIDGEWKEYPFEYLPAIVREHVGEAASQDCKFSGPMGVSNL